MNSTQFKLVKYLGLMLLAAVMFACSDDDALPADTEKPVVTVTSPAGTDSFSGIVNVKATASDNNGIAKIQLFVDNSTSPVAEVTTSTIDFAWDTHTVADGPHTLRVVATDAAANSNEAQAAVVVRNNIITFTVPAGYIPSGYAYHIIVSDNKGTVLDTKQLKNNTVYSLPAPEGFTGDKVTMTLYSIAPGTVPGHQLTTLANIPPGDYGYASTVTTPTPVSTGTAQVNVNGSDYKSLHLVGAGGLSATSQSTDASISYTVKLFQDKQPVLLTKNFGTPYVYAYTEIVPGGVYNLSSADLIEADTKPVTVPVEGDISISLYGYNSYGIMAYFVSPPILERTSATTVQIPVVPVANFTRYEAIMRVTDGDDVYGYYYSGVDLPKSIEQLDGTITFAREGNTITLGNAQADVVLTATQSISINNAQYSWSVYSAPGATAVVPEPPKTLVDTYQLPSFATLADAKVTHLQQYDYKGFSDFNDFIHQRYGLNPTVSITEYTYFYKVNQ